MSSQVFDLVVDTKDVWGSEREVFHLRPEKAHLTCCFDNGRFKSCSVYNTAVDEITPRFLSSLYDKLLPNSTVTVVVNQPISVMQEFDAKQIQANANCCGYTAVKISPYEVQEKDYTYNSLAVSFVRPARTVEGSVISASLTVKKN